MTKAAEAFDVIVLGAGAAGLMCALTAGQRGRRVLLLDHADKIGAKILISGGGRCNFTNLHCAPDRFLSGNPDFCRSALSRYTQDDFIALVERHRIPTTRRPSGNCSAMGRRAPSWRCCSLNARKAALMSGLATASAMFSMPTASASR